MSGVDRGICTAATVAALLAAFRAEAAVRRILLEMLAVVALAPLLDIFAGALLQAHAASCRRSRPCSISIPPFVSQAGALGGILSSRLSSKLQLGVITSRGRPEIPAVVDGAIVIVLGVLVFTAIGAVVWALLEARRTGPDPAPPLSDRRHDARRRDRAADHAGGRLLPRRAHRRASASTPTTRAFPSSRRSWTSPAWRRILLVMRTSGVLP